MAKDHSPWCVLKYGCTKHRGIKHAGKRKYCSLCLSLGYGYVPAPPDWPATPG